MHFFIYKPIFYCFHIYYFKNKIIDCNLANFFILGLPGVMLSFVRRTLIWPKIFSRRERTK